MEDYFHDYNDSIINLLKKTPTLSYFDTGSISSMLNHSRTLNLAKGEFTYKSGDIVSDLYFVISGSMSIVKIQKVQNYDSLIDPQKYEEQKYNGLNFLKKYQKYEEINLLKLLRGDYFGDESGFNSENLANYSLKSTSYQTQIIKIPKHVSCQQPP